MDTQTLLTLALFASTCILLMSGFPVAFTLAGVALLFSAIGSLVGMETLIGNLPGRIFGNAMTNETLMAVPFFIYMGVMMEKSRLAEDLLTALGGVLSHRPGGISLSVILVGALLAASTGVVGATVVTMGVIALPTMLRQGYPPAIACGTICAAGTLGQIIPPSIVLIILGDQITSAYQSAQSQLQQQAWATGDLDFTPQTVSIGDLFAGALLPGLVLVALYIAYLLIHWRLHPLSSSNTTTAPIGTDADAQQTPSVLAAILPALSLILAVLGSILAGIAAPTEAAAVGAVGAALLAARNRHPSSGNESEPAFVTVSAIAVAGMLLGGIIGAIAFLDTGWFLFGPLITAIFGAIALLSLNHVNALSPLLQSLSGFRVDVMRGGVYAAIAVFFLSLAFDLRIGRSTVTVMEQVGIVIAALLSLWIALAIVLAFYRVWRAGILVQVNRATLEITAMIFAILIGASMFSLVFRDFGGDDVIHAFLTTLPGGTSAAVFIVMLALFVLGFFLDFVEICFVVVPIVAPILLLSGDISPVWLGVMMALVLQTSFLTPPFGFALFYLRGVAPDTVRTLDIYKGVIPFIALQIVAVAILWGFPGLAEWLPKVIFDQ